jgi:ferredoxin
MESIDIDRTKWDDCGDCIKFCPTNAITLKNKSIIEAADNTKYPNLEDRDYPYIEKKLCIGCGSCANLCKNDVITLERTLGPVIITKKLHIHQDACVQCLLCEENCPVDAICLKGDQVVLDDEKCIRCHVCSSKCPVNALNLKDLADVDSNGSSDVDNNDSGDVEAKGEIK